MFAVRTENEEDIEYLEEILHQHPDEYHKFSAGEVESNTGNWTESYGGLKRDHLYVKIDDDIVFIKVRLMPQHLLQHVNALLGRL